MDKLRNMRLFCRVVELGSFVKVASDQNVSATIIGRHISNLEKSLGVRLVNRTTRTMEITEAGKRYYEGCKHLIGQMDALEQSVSDDSSTPPSGIIKVAAPDGMGSPFLLDAIETFQDLYPAVSVDLLLENTPTDVVSENVDIAVRLTTVLEDSSLIVRKLGATKLCLFGSPLYLESVGHPRNVVDLRDHQCLVFSTVRYGSNWPYISNGKIKKFEADWKFVTNHTQTYLDAIVRGFGLGLMPGILARQFVVSGDIELIELDEDFPEVGIYSILPYRDLVPQRVSLFLGHLQSYIRTTSH